jgi:5-methylcytosine-specific restriction endonuclease McrA
MPPSPDDQIRFLVSLQRLLAEGQFVATYKFALLLSLADLSVELGNDSGEPLVIGTNAIALKFIQYYWRQSAPYPTPGGTRVLQQNTGNQAAVIRLLERARTQQGGSFSVLQRSTSGTLLTRAVDQVVRTMPLWKLQTVGSERMEFLYHNVGRGTTITLLPGAAFCFRRFHELISDLVRGAWLRNVRQQNVAILGEATDLSEFLFGSERANLANVRSVLVEFQNGRCFYCGGILRPNATEVDHFISWARYPVDLGHNFVLADKQCNGKKRDRLPAVEHLSAWVERNRQHGDQILAGFHRQGVPENLGASLSVVGWAYSQTESAHGLTWRRGEELVPLELGWRAHLNPLTSAAPPE